jgi:hypothetical protein
MADFVIPIDNVCMRMMSNSGDLQLNVNCKKCRVMGWYLSRKFCSYDRGLKLKNQGLTTWYVMPIWTVDIEYILSTC